MARFIKRRRIRVIAPVFEKMRLLQVVAIVVNVTSRNRFEREAEVC